MGGGNPIQQVTNTVSNAVNWVVSTVNDTVVAPVSDAVSDAGRGDVGKFVGQIAGDTGRVLASPFVVASDLARGDIKQAGNTIGKAAGSALNISSGGLPYLAQTGAGKDLLTNDFVDKATLGYSSDYYGYTSAGRSLADSAYVSDANRNSSLRFGVKTAAIVGGAALYNSGAAGKAANYAYNNSGTVALYGGAASALAKGNLKEAAAKYAEANGGQSPIPDFITPYLPDGSSTYRSPASASGGSSVWSSGPASSQSGQGSVSEAIASASPLVGVALVVGAVFLAKKARAI